MTIDNFKDVTALVIGDLMIDEYLWGEVDRISPEAPVPVVSIKKESHTLGGAGNVIHNLVAMGAGVFAAGTAGKGTTGRMIFNKLEELDIATNSIITEADRPSTKKTRVIASNQQVLRIDREEKRDINASTFKRLIKIIQDKIPMINLLIISDYDKGLVTRDLVKETVRLAAEKKIPVLADPKSLDFSKYRGVSLLTPNKKEAALASHIDIKNTRDVFTAGRKIIDIAGLDKLVITCGKEGMVLFEKGHDPEVIESRARQVFDVSGAGDTVISILGLGLASGLDLKQSALIANAAAGIVVSKIGTATPTIEELKHALEE